MAAIDPALTQGLHTVQGRRDLIVEVLRVLVQTDLERTLASPSWRSYLVLRVAHVGVADDELRARVAASLRATEDRFTRSRARLLAASADLMGYRLGDSALAWETVASGENATFTGAVVTALAAPDFVTTTMECAPLGSSRPAPWSAAGLAAAAAFLAYLEPDPDIEWDDARVAATVAALADPERLLAGLWPEVAPPAGPGQDGPRAGDHTAP